MTLRGRIVLNGCVVLILTLLAALLPLAGTIVFGVPALGLGARTLQLAKREKDRMALESRASGVGEALQSARERLETSGRARPDVSFGEVLIHILFGATALIAGSGGLIGLVAAAASGEPGAVVAGLFFFGLGVLPAMFIVNHHRRRRRLGRAGPRQVEQEAIREFVSQREEESEERDLRRDDLAGRLTTVDESASAGGELSIGSEASGLSLPESIQAEKNTEIP